MSDSFDRAQREYDNQYEERKYRGRDTRIRRGHSREEQIYEEQEHQPRERHHDNEQ